MTNRIIYERKIGMFEKIVNWFLKTMTFGLESIILIFMAYSYSIYYFELEVPNESWLAYPSS